jgi:hypothetical protein
MTCDTRLAPRQTLAQRKAEVRKASAIIDKLIAQRKVGVKVGPQGAVTFTGVSDSDRAGMTDGCIYRMLTNGGSAAVRLAIHRAEMTAGRAVDRKAVAQGVHSHDGGNTWSTH